MSRKFVIPFLLSVLLLCFVLVIIPSTINCIQRNTQIPESPVYPDSTLQKLFDNGITTYRFVTRDYITDARPEDVIEFYKQNNASCAEIKNGRTHCRGIASPKYAEYFVYIDLESYGVSSKTYFVIEIRWRGCTTDLT